jgi:membrane associated rhomboid family serine protease
MPGSAPVESGSKRHSIPTAEFMPPLPPLTKALMLICTAVFCLGFFVRLELWFALWPLQSGLFWPWQLVSYGFLHGDMLHLSFNMLGLWMFGSELERLWGRQRYWQFLLASLLAAAATQLLITWLTRSMVPTVGASGALFGLLLAFGMLFPNRIIVPLIPPIPMKARTFVIVFGVLELVLGLYGRSGVAHFAHLGGMLGGFLMIRFWRGQAPFVGRRRR